MTAKTNVNMRAVVVSKWYGDRSARINVSLIGISILFTVIFGIVQPSFLSIGNFINIGHQMAITALLAFAMTAVILARGIDLSVGSTLALAGIVGALAFEDGIPPFFALVLMILTGILVGALNGVLITVFQISPFIATFGTMALCRGAALSLSGASSIGISDPTMVWLGSAKIGAVPVSIFLTLIAMTIWWIVLNRTVFGRYVYAVGGNYEATQASAINGKWVQFLTYVLSGGFAGVASILLLGRVQSAQPLGGLGLEFDVIMAVVIGGTKLSGGVGGISGTFFGAILVSLIRTGLSFFGTPQEVTYIVTGGMILLSVLLYEATGLRSVKIFHRKKDDSIPFSTLHSRRSADQGTHTLRLVNVGKVYSGVQVLDGVNMELRSGEVVALVGENGAGKSTLVKILSGIVLPDQGTVEIDGKPVLLKSPKISQQVGIGVIHQHYSLVPELSITENLYLGRELKWCGIGLIKRREMRKETQRLLNEFKIQLDPDTKVGDLTVGQCQLIEVVKATIGNPWLIIMDEPTSSLSKSESEKLYQLIQHLVRKNVCILYISHKMEEIYKLCNRAVILRDGKHVGNATLPDVSEESIINMMVGRKIESVFPYTEAKPMDVALEVENLSDGGLLRNASFFVRRGEVVVLAGLMGSGRSEVLKCIFGLSPIRHGTIKMFGEPVTSISPKLMARRGVAYVSEDRLYSGFVPMLSVRHNLSLAWISRHSKFGFIPMHKEASMVTAMIKKLNIKPPDPNKSTIHLSGGNQQKVVLGKWLVTEPEILLLDDPTRGVDVGAKSEIHQLIAELKEKGTAILMVSSELTEVLNVADRIIVMHQGMSVAELKHGATETEVMNFALGLENGPPLSRSMKVNK